MTKGRMIVLAVLLAIATAAPFILRNDYQRELLVIIAIFAIAGLSLDIIMGHMGQFSFGHSAVWGFGAYSSAILSLRYDVPVWAAMIIAVAFATIAGFVLGYVALRRTRGMELAIITFGAGAIVWLVAMAWHDFTGGMTGLHQVPAPPLWGSAKTRAGGGGLELRSEFAFYWLALIVLIVTIYFISRFLKSKMGRAVVSIRENEDLGASIGVSGTRYYVIAFTIACGLGGLAGTLYGHHLGFVNTGMLGIPFMIIMLVVVLIGGSGTLGGPVLGSAIYVWLSELLRFNQKMEELRFLVFGAIMLAVIIFMPRGVYPALLGVYKSIFEDRAWRSSTWRRLVVQRAWLGVLPFPRR